MFELDKIYCCDVLEGLKQLDDNSIDLIITSPPYNKKGFNGGSSKVRDCDLWHHTIDYGGDENVDNMPEEAYEQWQVDVINECIRVLKPDGSFFYNHKNRVKKNQMVSPLKWIEKSNAICRQQITWDRSSSPNMDKCRYVPCTEYLFWLIKQHKNPKFKRLDGDIPFPTEVWKFGPEQKNSHPAPFPIKLPDNIIPCVAQGEDIVVLDPFMGSGTVAVSAIKNKCHYIGFEKFQEYIDMANERIEKIKTND
jgi:modification methylase